MSIHSHDLGLKSSSTYMHTQRQNESLAMPGSQKGRDPPRLVTSIGSGKAYLPTVTDNCTRTRNEGTIRGKKQRNAMYNYTFLLLIDTLIPYTRTFFHYV